MSLTRRVFLERMAQIGGYSAVFRSMQVLGLTPAPGASPSPSSHPASGEARVWSSSAVGLPAWCLLTS